MRAADTQTMATAEAANWEPRAPRTVTTLMVGKLLCEGGGEQLCRVRNLSATGMLIESQRPLGYGNWVVVELRCGQKLQGSVVWSATGRAGVQFAAPIEVERVLAVAKGVSPTARLHKAVPRAPRFTVDRAARLVCNGESFPATVENLSQSGARVHMDALLELDRVVTLAIPGLAPRTSAVRWARDKAVGLAFIDMIPYAELSAWLEQIGVEH